MMDALAFRLAPFWVGVVVHLWHTALFVTLLAVVAHALRGSSARILSALYWTGVLKLLLPLPLLGPISDRMLESIAAAWAATPAGEGGWSTVSVLMYPVQLDSGPAGWAELPPAFYVAATSVWFVVAGSLFVRRLRTVRSRRHLDLRRIDACPPDVSAKLDAAVAQAGLGSEVVRVSSTIPGPFVRGALRPVIVLPDAVVVELDRDELRAVLIHEREHLRRRDPLRYAVLGVVRDLFWFFPPIWWLARRIRETTEMACDESVVVEGLTAATYCRSLARTLSVGLVRHGAVSPVGILGHRVSFLRLRLERIRSGRRFEAMFSHRVALIAAAAAALIFSMLPVVPLDGLGPQAAEFAPEQGLDALTEAHKTITLSFQQAPIEYVLQTITNASGVAFKTKSDLRDIRVDFDTGGEMELADVLRQLGMTAGLKFRVLGPNAVEVLPILLAGADGVTLPVLIPESKVSPTYPEEARANGIQGTVILQAVIDETGAVKKIEVLKVQPKDAEQLADSAAEAVRQWRYEPATRDGEPVAVYFTIRVDFRLDGAPKDA